MARKSYVKADDIQVKGNKIFSPVRQKWLPLTPEERVRQEYLRVLTQEYGYVTDQMAEEMDVTGRGSAQARADFVIWRSAQDKIDQKPPFIIVECKSECDHQGRGLRPRGTLFPDDRCPVFRHP